jgi:hypothetical protein
MTDSRLICLACGQTSDEIPIVQIRYLGSDIGICPQHLPILIHDPSRLSGQLTGAEGVQPADHHD